MEPEKTRTGDSAGPGGRSKSGWASGGSASSSTAATDHRVYLRPGFDWQAADAYLFDIDGTLLNSRDAVHYHAFHRAVEHFFGLDLRLDGIPVHGNTDIGILRAYLEAANVPESEWQPRVPDVMAFMCAEVARNGEDLRIEICPGILSGLNHLQSQGKLLGVASGNLESIGWAKVEKCGLRGYFSFGAFSGEREKRDDIIAHGIRQAKALCGPETCVYVVGDTPADIASAHANNAPVIAAATGIYSFRELLEHNPEMCIACCEDLLQPDLDDAPKPGI
ncbi:MAG TPA: HAD family hydrolase [Terriglobales bacterium]|nr:HAD family hydrolase [Terriglobales bacterium]